MALDPSIILGARTPQIDLSQFSPMNAMTNIMKLKQFEQESELNALKMQEYKRARDEELGLRNYLSGGREMPAPDLSLPETRTNLLRFGKKGAEQVEALTKQDTAALTQKKTAFEVQQAKQKFISQIQRDISNNPSDANITAYKEDLLANPLFDDAEKAQLVAGADRFLAMAPNERRSFLSSQGASAGELRPQVVAPGSSLVQGGSAVFTAPERQDTDLIRNFNAAKAQGFTGSIFDYERRIKEAGRPPAQPAQPVAPTITEIVDPRNPNQMLKIDARRYIGGSVGSPGVLGVGGKEPSAAARENKAELGKTQLADDLDNLRASFTRLDEMRAIPSTARNPLSNVAAGVAATGVGQKAGQLFGTEAQVERDVINSARSRLVNSIKNATGMSAQQLNSNVELQTMLKSISDPSQSVQAALRIIDDIENAYVKGAGMPKKQPAAGAAAPKPSVPAAPSPASQGGPSVSNW
jgi:hypothetical protein